MLYRITLVFGLVGAAFGGWPACAQDFPTKPVRFITGSAPGGTGDVLARVIGDRLAGKWKQAAVIDNRQGGGGMIASQGLLSAPADGHTVLIAAGSYLTITPWTVANLPYDVERDFTPIALIGQIPVVIAARADLPYRSVAELIAFAKANPGKVNYGANTPGSFPHLVTEYFAHQAGIQLSYVPYKGGPAAALQDILGGRLELITEGVPALGGAIKAGQIRPLGITSERRDAALPEVAAIGETLPGFAAIGFWAAVAHAATPEPIARRLSDDFRAVLAQPDIVRRLNDLGNQVPPMTREELAAFIRKDRALWGAQLKRMNLPPR